MLYATFGNLPMLAYPGFVVTFAAIIGRSGPMLTLVVTHLDGQPFSASLRGKFGMLGGTIGAMEGNTIVLPDAGGRVSPLEAHIMTSPRGYVIRNCGANPLQVNKEAVASSAEVPLAP